MNYKRQQIFIDRTAKILSIWHKKSASLKEFNNLVQAHIDRPLSNNQDCIGSQPHMP